jgi:hypothetical protein
MPGVARALTLQDKESRVPLTPELTTRRSHRDRVVVVASMASAAVAGAVLAVVAMAPIAPSPPAPPPSPSPAPPPQAVLADEPEAAASDPIVRAGACSASLRAVAYVQDVSATDAAELVQVIDAWLREPASYRVGPRIEHQRGVVYVESEEDRGDSPPYPTSASPEAARVCGTAAGWLRSDLEARLSHAEGLTCDGNVCCYHGGVEYAPDGAVSFHRVEDPDGEARWVLDAWVEVYTTALGAEYVDENRRFATTSLRRLASTGCPGEPAGTD